MKKEVVLKEKAITLRRKGNTYSEILARVPVAKSTLSIWLRDVGLSKRQHHVLTQKKKIAQRRGGARRKELRILESQKIYQQSIAEVGQLSSRELFLLGAVMYWAEGAKAKEYRPSVGIDFANSDPEMIGMFMSWLRETFRLQDSAFMLTIHLHENEKERMSEVERFWLTITGLPRTCLTKPIYKRHNPKTRRKSVGTTYRGLVAISVRRSTNMNRRIQGWIYGIIKAHKNHCQIV